MRGHVAEIRGRLVIARGFKNPEIDLLIIELAIAAGLGASKAALLSEQSLNSGKTKLVPRRIQSGQIGRVGGDIEAKIKKSHLNIVIVWQWGADVDHHIPLARGGGEVNGRLALAKALADDPGSKEEQRFDFHI